MLNIILRIIYLICLFIEGLENLFLIFPNLLLLLSNCTPDLLPHQKHHRQEYKHPDHPIVISPKLYYFPSPLSGTFNYPSPPAGEGSPKGRVGAGRGWREAPGEGRGSPRDSRRSHAPHPAFGHLLPSPLWGGAGWGGGSAVTRGWMGLPLRVHGEPIGYLHFPIDAAISMMDVKDTTHTLDVALAGTEGCSGASVAQGSDLSPCVNIVEIGVGPCVCPPPLSWNSCHACPTSEQPYHVTTG